MSQWKGPFKELYDFALETGAKDTLDQFRSLKAEFAETGTIAGKAPATPREQTDALLAAIEDALQESAARVKTRKPYSYGLVTSHPPKVF